MKIIWTKCLAGCLAVSELFPMWNYCVLISNRASRFHFLCLLEEEAVWNSLSQLEVSKNKEIKKIRASLLFSCAINISKMFSSRTDGNMKPNIFLSGWIGFINEGLFLKSTSVITFRSLHYCNATHAHTHKHAHIYFPQHLITSVAIKRLLPDQYGERLCI